MNIKAVLGAWAVLALTACGPSGESAAPQAAQQPGIGDACALAGDAAALFERAVRAENQGAMGAIAGRCQWEAEDGSLGANIMVFDAASLGATTADSQYAQMAGEQAAMGAVSPVAGLGDEAQAVDIMGQAQIVFRKGSVTALIGARSSDPALTSAALAERVARAAAEKVG